MQLISTHIWLLFLVLGCAPAPLYHGGPGLARKPAGLPTNKPETDIQWPLHTMTGIASFYGKEFHGRKTASGETFDMNAVTAAHRTLPFGTQVRVTHLDSGRSVTVRINDRGPFVKGRIIDLSQAAARAIGLDGVGQVRLEVLQYPKQ